MNEMQLLPINMLEEHPDNPRKEIGNVDDLAASIKQSGVLQNLTVVPHEGKYRIIIGHRRYNAAKIAGLEELPCTVIDMPYKEQIATMLAENMQRTDLTIVEQSQGMQMMFDLGETVSDIAQKTGFTDQTISKRLKIAKLPHDKLKAAEERGGRLDDYLKVLEIRDEKEREKLLEKVGTRDFNYDYERKLRDQILEEKTPLIIAEVKKFATKGKDSDKWNGEYKKEAEIQITKWNPGEALLKEIKKDVKYKYVESYGTLYILKPEKKKRAAPVKKSEAEKEADRCRATLKEDFEAAFKLRKEFIENFNSPQKYDEIISKYLAFFAVKNSFEYSGTNKNIWKELTKDQSHNYSDDEKAYVETFTMNDKFGKLYAAYYISGDNPDRNCHFYSAGKDKPPFRENILLTKIYEFLKALGYEISTAEQALIDGSDKRYRKKAEKDGN